MSKPQHAGESKPSLPQFDRAEFTRDTPHGTFCRECRTPIRDEYYDVSGNVVCSTCQANRFRLRGRLFRTFKALIFGSVAAAVGAGIYRMVVLGTGWNFSLVALLSSSALACGKPGR